MSESDVIGCAFEAVVAPDSYTQQERIQAEFERQRHGVTSVCEIEHQATGTVRHLRIYAIYNAADIGMCVTDSEGKFVEVNDAYCRIYGYRRNEFIGQSFTKVLPPESRNYSQQLHNEFVAEGTDTSASEWQVKHKNGFMCDVLVTAARLSLADGRHFKVTTVTDITGLKLIERQLRYQAEWLQNISDAVIAVNNA